MRQLYWNFAYAGAIICVALSWIGATRFRAKMTEFEEVKVAGYSDLLYLVFIFFPLYAGIRITFNKLFENTILKKLQQNDPDNYETKKVRVVKEAFGSFWYGIQALMAYLLFANTELLPTLCFGTLECGDFFRGWPLTMPDWKLRSFFMLQMAFHLYTAIEFELKNREQKVPEYNEMRLHHCLAIIMIFLCYISNTFPFGVTILFVADFTDMPLNMAKFSRDMKILPKTHIREIIFGWTVVSWLYFRGVVMGFCVMKGCFTAMYHIFTYDKAWFNKIARETIFPLLPHFIAKTGMEIILLLLNFYWIYLLLKIAYNRIVNNDTNFANKNWGEKAKHSDRTSNTDGSLSQKSVSSRENRTTTQQNPDEKKTK